VNTTNLEETTWSWADIISSYRFWGIALFYILFGVSNAAYAMCSLFINTHLGYDWKLVGIGYTIQGISSCFGIYLAWFSTRTKHHALYLYGILLIIGMFLICFTQNIIAIPIGMGLFGLATGATLLTVPSIISGSRGGAEVFVLSFGTIFVIYQIFYMASNNALGHFFDESGNFTIAFFLATIIPITLGMLLLLPVNSKLFSENPPLKNDSFPPKPRDPFGVAILSLIVPFYSIYWAYRIHGEAKHLSKTSKLLSPKASAVLLFLIPFLVPIIVVTLNDCLNITKSQISTIAKRPTWVVIVWCIICYPVSFAIIQSDVNRLVAE
jgi:hypothetical protein